ncbi:unnamed protein product [Sphenostylis stenocarpa]|uniref:Uncharacterized protein n=1 Tax=Sphenostylis stenocarpa TaxID=92480 RepID=A0AA86SFL0_9FABA|nr:unnamed protein product [Sphenostylis stenocarpa]
MVGFVAADGVLGEAAFGNLEGATVVVVGGLLAEEVGEDAATGGFHDGVPEEGDAAIGLEVGNFDGAPPCAWALIEASGKQRLAKASAQNIAAIVGYDLNGAECSKCKNIIRGIIVLENQKVPSLALLWAVYRLVLSQLVSPFSSLLPKLI